MSLINQIKRNQLDARKCKVSSTVSLLTTLIGDAEKIGKDAGNRESTDVEVIGVIKKFIKNCNEVKRVTEVDSVAHIAANNEITILEIYLPKQLNEEELRAIVQKQIATLDEISPKLMGKIMKYLKENHNGQYDGQLASKVVKELLIR